MVYDVLIIGSGIAGLMAAIEAKSENNKVAIITKGNILKSNSALASGGINAVLDEKDTSLIQKHIDDTCHDDPKKGHDQHIAEGCQILLGIVSISAHKCK